MKKIITLLFCIGAFATSFAQYNHRQDNDDRIYRTQEHRNDPYANDRNYSWNGRRRGGNRDNYNSARERDFQIDKINRDFEYQVQAIRNDRYLRHREKKAAIRNAKIERSRQLQMVNERFSDYR